jgi:hypothetical protein
MQWTNVLCNIQMLGKLSKQLSTKDWTWNTLNTLCWAIGSISGSMIEEQVLEINLICIVHTMRNYHIFLIHFSFIAGEQIFGYGHS